MWNLKSNTNEGIHKIETASLIEKATLLPKERGEGGETSVWYGINRFKLLYIKQIRHTIACIAGIVQNKDILYSTGNYTIVIACNRT